MPLRLESYETFLLQYSLVPIKNFCLYPNFAATVREAAPTTLLLKSTTKLPVIGIAGMQHENPRRYLYVIKQ
jgi:hypothetical protein